MDLLTKQPVVGHLAQILSEYIVNLSACLLSYLGKMDPPHPAYTIRHLKNQAVFGQGFQDFITEDLPVTSQKVLPWTRRLPIIVAGTAAVAQRLHVHFVNPCASEGAKK